MHFFLNIAVSPPSDNKERDCPGKGRGVARVGWGIWMPVLPKSGLYSVKF
jgi:hypothetical protein